MSSDNLSKDNTTEKDKNLKHIKVYNKLHELIKNGAFPVGFQLPTEPELAIKMEVSRVTLRKALAILQTEGLISNVRGKGNFVSSPEQPKQTFEYIKKIQHPFYACTKLSITEIDVNFTIEPPTEAMLSALQTETAVVVVCNRWYKKSSQYVGYSQSYIPIEVITQNKINLNNESEFEKFIESYIYNQTIKSSSTLSYTTDDNAISQQHKISEKNSYILLTENLYSKENNIIMYTSYYIPSSHFNVTINLNDKFEF